MYLIGTRLLRLKFFLIFGGLCLLSLFYMSSAHALERILTKEEVEKLQKNIRLQPNNVVARRFLMDHYLKAEKWQEAITVAQPMQKDLPAKEQLLLIKAHLHLQDGKGASAVIGFYQSQYGITSESKVLEAEALTLLANKDPVEATRRQKAIDIITVLREAIRLNPQNELAYFRWIKVLEAFWTTYADDALQVYHLLEVATKNPLAYLNEKCALYVKAELWDQALETCKRTVRYENSTAESFLNLSKAQHIKESLQESKKTLKDLIVRFPNSAAAHKALGSDYFEENNFILAAEHFKKATALDPNDSESFLLLAQSDFRQKKYLDALAAYKKNCQISRTLASEFKHSTGELRSNYPLHNKYKKVMSSCQK